MSAPPPGLREIGDAVRSLVHLRARRDSEQHEIARLAASVAALDELITHAAAVTAIERGIPLVERAGPERVEIRQAGPAPARRAEAYLDQRDRRSWIARGFERADPRPGWRERELGRELERTGAIALARRWCTGGDVRRPGGFDGACFARAAFDAFVLDIAAAHAGLDPRPSVDWSFGERYLTISLRGGSLGLGATPYAAIDLHTGDLLPLAPSGSMGAPVGNLVEGDPSRGRAALRPLRLLRRREIDPLIAALDAIDRT